MNKNEEKIEKKEPAIIENRIYFNKESGMSSIVDTFVKNKRSFEFSYTANKGYIMTDTNIGFDLVASGESNGMHLCSMALNDIEKRTNSGEYVPIYKGDEIPETVIFNTPVIRDCIENNLQSVAIDINNCYWETAHNLGIISDSTHKSGYNQVEKYKKGRRAAIGSFNAEKITEKYVKGVKVWETPIELRHRQYNYARVHVVDYVFQMALDIAQEIPHAVAMFLTDCFFVHPDYEQFIYDELLKRNYKAKKKPIWFCSLENGYRSTKIVKWDCQETLLIKATKIKDYTPHLHYYNTKNELSTILTNRNNNYLENSK